MLIAYLTLMLAGLAFLNPAVNANAYTAYAAVVTALFLLVVWRTGEPPRWRSGAE